MYQETLNNIAYKVLFNNFNVFHPVFWDSCNFLAGAFFAFWGVKIGAKFLRYAILNV